MIQCNHYASHVLLCLFFFTACLERSENLKPREEVTLYPLFSFQGCTSDDDCEVVSVGNVNQCQEFGAVNRKYIGAYNQQRSAQAMNVGVNCAPELELLEPYCELQFCRQKKKKDYSCAQVTIPHDTVNLTMFPVSSHSVSFSHAVSNACLTWPAPKAAHGDEATFLFKPQKANKYRLVLHHDGKVGRYIFVGSGEGDCNGTPAMSCIYCPAGNTQCVEVLTGQATRDHAFIIATRNCNQHCFLSIQDLGPNRKHQTAQMYE